MIFSNLFVYENFCFLLEEAFLYRYEYRLRRHVSDKMLEKHISF